MPLPTPSLLESLSHLHFFPELHPQLLPLYLYLDVTFLHLPGPNLLPRPPLALSEVFFVTTDETLVFQFTQAKNLGVNLDPSLLLTPHFGSINKSHCLYLLHVSGAGPLSLPLLPPWYKLSPKQRPIDHCCHFALNFPRVPT